MQYLDFLAQVHDHLKPRSYLELSGSPSAEIAPSTIDLAFLSGQRRYELVLNDFLAVEKQTGPGSVILIDDVLPRAVEESTPEGTTGAGVGDAWKIIPSLRAVRPDLLLLLVRTTPTGMLMVLGADLTDTDLVAAREHLLTQHVGSGQEPTAEILTRSTAVYPTWLVGAPFWEVLREQRAQGITAAEGRDELLANLQTWASTRLNDKQAKAIHPSLIGKQRPVKSARRTVSIRPASTRPGGGGERRGRTGRQAHRVLTGVRRRITKLVLVSKRAVSSDRHKDSGSS